MTSHNTSSSARAGPAQAATVTYALLCHRIPFAFLPYPLYFNFNFKGLHSSLSL